MYKKLISMALIKFPGVTNYFCARLERLVLDWIM